MAILTHDSQYLRVVGLGIPANNAVGVASLVVTGLQPTTTATPSVKVTVGFASISITGQSVTAVVTVPQPFITGISSPVVEGGTVTITGTDLDAVDFVLFGGEERDIVTQTETEITFVASLGGVPYGSTTVEIKNSFYTDSDILTFTPVVGRDYNVVAGFPVIGDDLSVLTDASPTVVNGDQFEFDTTTYQGAAITMNADGTFEIATTGGHSFDVRAWDASDSTWGDWQIMDVNRESVVAKPSFRNLDLNGIAPTIITDYVVTLTATSLSIQGNQPTPVTEFSVSAGVTNLNVTGYAPILQIDQATNIVVPVGFDTLVITGYSPSSSYGTSTLVGDGTLVIQGLEASELTTNPGEVQVQPGIAVLTLQGLQPLVKAETLQAPAELMTVVVSSTQIDISWSAYEGATSYTLERETSDGLGGWTDLIRVEGITDTFYSDTDLEAGQTYRYRVRAVTEA